MQVVKTAKKQMEGVFKSVPPLPEASREALAKFWPWLALVSGVVQLLVALSLWNFVRTFGERINVYSIYLTGQAVLSGTDKMIIYLGLIMLLVDGVILLMAYSPLKARSRRGWDLLFLAALLNLVYAVVALFMEGHGFGSFLMSLLSSAVGFYLLFQVRSKFAK